MEFIHHGSEHFEKEKFKMVTKMDDRLMRNKPGNNEGLWASPVTKDGTDSWNEWCDEHDFSIGDNSKWFKFKLKEGSKVLVLKNKEDLDRFSESKYQRHFDFLHLPLGTSEHDLYPDFYKLKDDYDAILVYITWEGEDGLDGSYYRLYGWDADSLLIFNPEVIVETDSSDKGGK